MITTVVTIGVDFAIIVDCSHSNPTRAHTRTVRPLQALTALCLCLRSSSPRSRCLCSLRPSTRSCASSTTSSRAVGTSNCECVELTCFKGPDAAADLLDLLLAERSSSAASRPSWTRRSTRARASASSRRPRTGAVSSKGRTKTPSRARRSTTIEPESASMANPMYEFDFAGAWDDFIGHHCRRRVRQVLLVQGARAAHPLVARRLHRLARLAVQLCHVRGQRHRQLPDNGSWYIDACGPWGTELLPYGSGRGSTPRASLEIDSRIFDSYAASIIDLNERIGAGRDAYFAQYVQAAHQWQSVDPENMEERALAFVYHTCRNMRHEAEENGLTYDQPRSTRTWTPTRSRAPRRSSCTTRMRSAIEHLRALTRTYAHTKSLQECLPLFLVAGAAASSTRSSRPAAGGCTTWATSSRRAARTRCGARRRRSSA